MGLTHCRWIFAALVAALALTACGRSSNAPKTTPPTTTPTSTTGTTPTSGTGTTTGPTSTTTPTSATGTTTSPAKALAADQTAEGVARGASAAALTFGTNHNGSYAGLTAAAIHALASAVQVGPGDGNAYLALPGGVRVLGQGAGYSVTATSTTGDTFSLGESGSGTATTSCTGSASTACKSGTW
jgi:hypothetical protein